MKMTVKTKPDAWQVKLEISLTARRFQELFELWLEAACRRLRGEARGRLS